MIKAVIFDCFGVLYSRSRADFYAQKMPNFEEHRGLLKDLGNQADYGLISEQDYYDEVANITGIDANEIKEGLGSHTKNVKLIEYIKQLGTTYNIGLISNISRGAMDSYFSKDELGELFDDVVLSSDVGMIKPHPEIFELAAERLGFDPSECVFIDDIEDNVKGAISIGMIGIVYTDVNKLIADLSHLLDASSDKL